MLVCCAEWKQCWYVVLSGNRVLVCCAEWTQSVGILC